MKYAIAAAACIGLLAACGPEGADRQSGAVENAVPADSISRVPAPGDTAPGDTAPGVTDSTGAGTAGTGTTGAQAGGSGAPAAGRDAPVPDRPERD